MTAVSDETGRNRKRDAYIGVLASLAAAISLLENTPRSKKAAASDKMFDQMVADYKKALDEGRAALSASPVTNATVPLEDIASEIRQVLVDAAHATKDLKVSASSAMFKAEKLVTATISKFLNATVYVAPVAQEPVAWVEFTEAGLIRFWTSDPARAEAERTRRSLTKFTLSELIALVGRPRTPPATPAGVGADEIAQIIFAFAAVMIAKIIWGKQKSPTL